MNIKYRQNLVVKEKYKSLKILLQRWWSKKNIFQSLNDLVEESYILLIDEKEDFPLLDEENVQLESNKSEGIHVVNSTYKKML